LLNTKQWGLLSSNLTAKNAEGAETNSSG